MEKLRIEDVVDRAARAKEAFRFNMAWATGAAIIGPLGVWFASRASDPEYANGLSALSCAAIGSLVATGLWALDASRQQRSLEAIIVNHQLRLTEMGVSSAIADMPNDFADEDLLPSNSPVPQQGS